jgi:hypothetical protein
MNAILAGVDESHGFAIALRLKVIDWILDYYGALQANEPGRLTDSMKHRLIITQKTFERLLESTPFPQKVKDNARDIFAEKIER